ncbi:MMPL family transporter [Herbiconiux sp.]|uniref:MMPL family transporter n=1 Tax=Herbiconiux sp. TaxID=1871186 RepID=UPI0025BDFB36|nr:MMPL family transporter [Herbiconiux sp.]
MLESLGRWVARRRVIVLAAWGALILAGVVLGGGVFDHTSPVEDSPTGSESKLADVRLDALDPEGEIVTAVLTGTDFYSPELIANAGAVMQQLREVPGVVEVKDAYTSGGIVGDDGRSSLVTVELEQSLDEASTLAAATEVSELLRTIEPADVLVGGKFLAEQAFVDRAVTDAAIGEGIAIVVLFVLLVVVLGGVRVAAFPVVAALAVIAVALLALSGLILLMPVNEFAVNIVTILSLGLAVDYSLLVIARFREERHRHPEASLVDWVGATVASSGRAVLVSGLAVFIALVGLMLLGDPLLSGMAVGGAASVLLATLAGLTLVPAMLAAFSRHVPAPGRRRWPLRSIPADAVRVGALGRLAMLAQRRPVAVAVGAGAVLLLLAAPLATLTVGSSDIRALPVEAEERRTSEFVDAGFADLSETAASVLISAPVTDPRVVGLLDEIAAHELVIDADQVLDLPQDVTVADFAAPGDTTGAEAQQLVRDIRSLAGSAAYADLEVQVGGPAAEVVDTQDHLLERLPLALGVVLVATFGLLFALTRSVVIPLKAVVLNALTVAATVGALVAVFQWGWGAGLLGFAPWGALDVTTPLMIALLAFGLSMDYEVFLLARIAEEWRARDRSIDPRVANDRAVLRGITATGPVVTTAAVAIGVVFLGFSASSLVGMKEVGIGMAIAILLDVTIVRGLLLPALMTLLGRWNWVGPGFGRRGGRAGGDAGGGETGRSADSRPAEALVESGSRS